MGSQCQQIEQEPSSIPIQPAQPVTSAAEKSLETVDETVDDILGKRKALTSCFTPSMDKWATWGVIPSPQFYY